MSEKDLFYTDSDFRVANNRLTKVLFGLKPGMTKKQTETLYNQCKLIMTALKPKE